MAARGGVFENVTYNVSTPSVSTTVSHFHDADQGGVFDNVLAGGDNLIAVSTVNNFIHNLDKGLVYVGPTMDGRGGTQTNDSGTSTSRSMYWSA